MEGARFAAQLLVHDRWEVDIQDHIVVDGQPQHNAHQRELSIILKAVGVEPEGTCLIVEAEHGCKVQLIIVLISGAVAYMVFINTKLRIWREIIAQNKGFSIHCLLNYQGKFFLNSR